MTVLLSNWVIPFFFLTFYGTSLTKHGTNIMCDCIFVTFSGSLIFFFSYFMIPASHYAIPTLYVTVLLSHLVVSLFFFLTFYGTSLTKHSTNITCDCIFVTFSGFLFFFFLIFYGTSLTLRNTNITCYYTFVTFGGSLIFFSSHFMVSASYCVVPT